MRAEPARGCCRCSCAQLARTTVRPQACWMQPQLVPVNTASSRACSHSSYTSTLHLCQPQVDQPSSCKLHLQRGQNNVQGMQPCQVCG